MRHSQRTVILLAAGASTCLLAAAEAADWPQWRGPNRDGISTETGWSVTGKAESAWSRAVGLGYSSVVVRDDRLWTMGFDAERQLDIIHCLDAATGKPVWSHTYGAKIWDRMHGGGTLTTPSLDGDVVYTLNREGKYHCLEAGTGEVVFADDLMQRFELEYPEWGFSASPLVLDDMIVVNVGRVIAFKKKSTEPIWQTERNYGDAYSTPADFRLGGRPCLAVFNAQGLAVLDRKTGKHLAFHPWKTQYEINAATPVVRGETVFISSGLNRGCALLKLGQGDPEVLWESKKMRNKMTGCVLWQDHLYGFDESIFKCLDLEGNVAWSQRGLGNGAFMVADGKLILMSSKGELIIAKASPDGFEELSRTKVLDGGVYWTSPVIANGRIYCRNSTGELVCRDHRRSGE
jgi:outer membrane protein assembly factor BamB